MGQYIIRKGPVIVAVYFFTLILRKAPAISCVSWKLKDPWFSSHVLELVIDFDLSPFEPSGELGKEIPIKIIPIKRFSRFKLFK